MIPGILLFLLAGTWQTISTGKLSTGVPWFFTAGMDSSLSTPIEFFPVKDTQKIESWNSQGVRGDLLKVSEVGFDGKSEERFDDWSSAYAPEESDTHLQVLGLIGKLEEHQSNNVPVPPSQKGDKDGYGYDDVSVLPTALQVFIVFGFLSVHQLITFTAFNVLLRFQVIRNDNLVVAYIISISGFFCLVLAAGDSLLKTCTLTAAYFTCVTLFLFFLVFLVKTQARWYAQQNPQGSR